jgi:hypothetical protein
MRFGAMVPDELGVPEIRPPELIESPTDARIPSGSVQTYGVKGLPTFVVHR